MFSCSSETTQKCIQCGSFLFHYIGHSLYTFSLDNCVLQFWIFFLDIFCLFNLLFPSIKSVLSFWNGHHLDLLTWSSIFFSFSLLTFPLLVLLFYFLDLCQLHHLIFYFMLPYVELSKSLFLFCWILFYRTVYLFHVYLSAVICCICFALFCTTLSFLSVWISITQLKVQY